MKQLIESRFKGIFRSYKIFRLNGDVIFHTVDDYQEWDLDENNILTISHYQKHRKTVLCHTDQWVITFENKRYYITIQQPPMRLEIISINHTGLVIENSTRSEKIFFAPVPAWENLVKNRLHIL